MKKKISLKKIITKKKPEKRLVLSLKKKAGRSSSGRITVRHRGGGAKKLYRLVDFDQKKIDLPAKVIAIEYDPYRTSYIVLLEYEDKDKRYRLAWQGVKIGDEVIISDKAPLKPGNRMKLKNIPVGTAIYNVELKPGQGGQLAKGAGTSINILAQEGGFTHLSMPSSEIRKVSEKCFASIGAISKPEHRFIVIGKAGKSRHKGRRPRVRGSAMNPCDHPHGGGEGRSPIGMKYPKTPWGKPALGVKTRKKRRSNKHILKRRIKK